MRGHPARLLSLHSISIHRLTASTNRLQLQVDRGGAQCRVYDLVFASAVKAALHGLLSVALHMHSAGLLGQRRLFAVPDFSANLAVFIPGKSGMKKYRKGLFLQHCLL